MSGTSATERLSVADVVERYGQCLELIPIDPSFHDISVGLFAKEGVATVWTFSRRPGVETRVKRIRDQLVALGGLEPLEGTHDQVRPPCGRLHGRPTKFLMMQAVEKAPNYAPPEGAVAVKDYRSGLMLGVESRDVDGRVVYYPTAEGEAPNKAARLRAVAAGFVRYGEMEKTDNGGVAFSCGFRHDELVRLLLPYARNVSHVEDMLDADAMRGQMTTSTLGFSPPT